MGNRKGGISGKRKGMSFAVGDNVPVGCAKHRWLCPYRRVGCFPRDKEEGMDKNN